ncbi:hypothetical protein ACFQMA_09885 [Halosimplex aquaticum]|uniref:DNA-binding protein n=1 Tax=Halosimplex aquaticum TaxID=3026162 RepID=A0ABD5Y470_9EURY|nr:hypothetical protein [Halosimplex aquaticum]
MSWGELFERADRREVTVADVRESLVRRREGDDDGDGTAEVSGS